MEFRSGTKITVIDEDLIGVVKRQEGNWVFFECEDGFEYSYPASALCTVGEEGEVEHQARSFNYQIEKHLKDDKKKVASIKFQGKKPEFDLHLEVLFPDQPPASDRAALSYQVDRAAEILNRAIELRVKNLVLIHGRGQGILREELRNMMDERFPNVEYFDANYMRYGGGATEVWIHGLGNI